MNLRAKINGKRGVLLKNTMMLYILQFSTYFFGFIVVPYETRVLGPVIYGMVGAAMAAMIYFQNVIDFGFILSGTADVALHREDKGYLSRLFTAVVWGKVLLAAHLDTVFGPGFAEKHPFHIEGEWAHGLGAGDCKSGVLISLFGALILKKAGLLPPWELTYLFTCDEETGSRSGRKVYAREAQDAALALVFEGGRERDGRPRFVTSRRGVILGTVDVAGREAHAGKAYLEGRSAVLELAHQIIRLYSFNDYEKGIYYNVAPISGGRPNGVVAGEARGEFCVAGIPENADFPVIQARLDSMADQVTVEGCRVRVAYRTLFPAMERNAANHSADLRAAEAAELLGWEPEEIADPTATDGAYLSTYGVPTVDALSAIAEQIHTTEERVRIPSIRDRTALCAAMLGLLG